MRTSRGGAPKSEADLEVRFATLAAMPRPHPLRSLLILSLAALAFALAQTMLIPALTELAKSLNTDASGVAWTVTAYLLAAAVCTPVFGRLGDMFGKRRLLVVALGIFVAGSVISALGTSLEVVVAGRVLQGAGGGIFPLCFGIIRDEFPREKVGSSIGLISATFGIGGGAGLILGGLITDHTSYHWIFWLGAISAALAAVFIELFVPESPVRTPGPRRRARRDRARPRADRAAAGDRQGQRVGLGRHAHARPVRGRRGDPQLLGLAPAPHSRAARRHRDAAPADRGDDQLRDRARRLRHVRLVHPHPAARRGAEVERLRLRARRHRRRRC